MPYEYDYKVIIQLTTGFGSEHEDGTQNHYDWEDDGRLRSLPLPHRHLLVNVRHMFSGK